MSYFPPGEHLLRDMAESWMKIDQSDVPVMGTPLQYSSFRVGDPIGDKWVVLGVVGRGRLCVVYLALDKEARELVALKTIRNDIHAKDVDHQRFYDEAHSWVKIGQHPNILEAKRVDNVAGQIYVSMEYIPPTEGKKGSSLREWLRNGNPLNPERILKWAIQFCYGMIHANHYGIRCHLDIKPENILIDHEERVRIADFGLSNGVSGFGTPPYMPPEQFDSGIKPKILNDIYSFGMVLFEMGTGRLPFNPDLFRYSNRYLNLKEAWRMAWQEVHRSHPVPDVGEPFGKIIKKCLEKDREKRFRDFEKLLEELMEISRELNVAVDEPVIEPLTTLDLCTKGEQFLAIGLYDESMRLFEQMLNDDSNNSLALNGKGLSLFFVSRWEEALSHFERVLSIHPENVSALIGKGLCLRSLKNDDQANKCFNRALEIQPRLPVILYQMAESWLDRGLPEKAKEYYYQAIQVLISLKRKEEALEVVGQALKHFAHDLRLLQLNAWVHRIRGDAEYKEELVRSQQILEKLFKKGERDAETLGILAGTYKRLWKRDPEKNKNLLPMASELYTQAWEDSEHKNTYVGINAATLSLLLGRGEDSRNIANEIWQIYQRRELTSLTITGTPFSSYWDRATLAEAELLLGRLGKARRLYRDIMDLYFEKRGYIESSMDQIDHILCEMGLSLNAVKFLELSPGTPEPRRVCCGITGHRKLFSPETLEEKVKEALIQIKQNLPKKIQREILSPLAEGADRLAVKVILEEPDAILRVVLPLPVEGYLQDFSNTRSEDEFKSYLNQAEEIIYLPPVENRNEAYRNAGYYVVDNCDILIALWDGKEAKGLGGTAEIVAYARKRGLPLIWIDPTSLHEVTFERLEKLKTIDFIKGKGEFDMYKPKPIDTSKIQLSDDLLELTELLAENNHDHWAILRFKEGYKWGPKRDDDIKTNPDLVPYNDLPESEKEFDRRNALETLKAIIALGYRIDKR